MSRLLALAQDIREEFRCDCHVDDLPDGEACPCGGDGRDSDGEPWSFQGCWHCQALAAIAEATAAPRKWKRAKASERTKTK